MSNISDSEKKFLDKHFKAGEYAALTILVNNKELSKLVDLLKNSGLHLAIMPSVKAKMAFADDSEGTEQ